MVTVPDFTGMTQSEVETSIHSTNFDFVFVVGDSADPNDSGKVYAQSLTSNSSVLKDSQITLTLRP